jgi:uncharacterized sporulation protein YeaH/YhbH (DUF444 family)
MGLFRDEDSYRQALAGHIRTLARTVARDKVLSRGEKERLTALQAELAAELDARPQATRAATSTPDAAAEMRQIRRREGWLPPFRYRLVRNVPKTGRPGLTSALAALGRALGSFGGARRGR